ncbi:MAG: NAD-dependent epimerase/dehydratase family protein [Nitrospina sp.]|jgi:nucleoside-diphosphate-sugar epimerase|nr:NAD-dependent epimerase/dehydratase family protein [Nitrospina sp.]
MILGSGLLARAFGPHFANSATSCVYAAGVSNSGCSDQREFDREQDRLKGAISQYRSADLFLYFGTCSATSPMEDASPYVQHKIRMEKLVEGHPRYLILRLPQTAGKTENPHTLLNYIFARIIRSERFQVWKNARRNIIDVDDVVRIAVDLALKEGVRRECVNVANVSDNAMVEIVDLMAKVVGKNAICDYVDKGDAYPIDTRRIGEVARRCGVGFGPDYLESIIRKYFGSAAPTFPQ